MLELYDITAEDGKLINKIKITEPDKELVFSNLTAKTKYAIMLKDESQKILAYRNVTTRENNQGTYIFVGVPKVQGVKGYLLDSGEQLIMGSLTDKVTVLGTAGQVGLSLTGVDFVADVRDVSADLINWEWTWGHAGQTTLDGIGLVPIIGVVKNGDEVALLFRSGKKIDEAIDALDDGSKYISKQFMKEVEQAGIKYSKETTIGLAKTSSGKINWLELGNDKTGLQHIMKNYGKDFADWGLKSDEQVADIILKAISKDKGVSLGDGIKIFNVNIDGSVKQIKVVTDSNGLISSAQPIIKGVGKGFNTFNDAKKFLGSPGQGNQWHHIVEQSQISKSGFSPTQIQNTNNLIAVDSATHAKISGYYSSKPEFARGKTVRDWLAGQSYEEQYKFGLDVLNRFGIK